MKDPGTSKPLWGDVVVFLQARVSSRRLPGKVLRKVYGKPLLGYLIERLLTAKLPIVVIIPQTEFKFFISLKKKYPSINFYGGNKYNVLKRFYNASQVYPANHYIRVTGDNPFTSITCMKKLLKEHLCFQADLSYYQNLPYGAGVEIISQQALRLNYENATKSYDREHVTPWLHRMADKALGKVKIFNPQAPKWYRRPEQRVTIDTHKDLNVFRSRVKILQENQKPFSLKNMLMMEALKK